MYCRHVPPCPEPESMDRDAARIVARHPEQGWYLLCNGVIIFDDTGELLPNGRMIEPNRGPAPHQSASPRLSGSSPPIATRQGPRDFSMRHGGGDSERARQGSFRRAGH
jgi:hypothetical protein